MLVAGLGTHLLIFSVDCCLCFHALVRSRNTGNHIKQCISEQKCNVTFCCPYLTFLLSRIQMLCILRWVCLGKKQKLAIQLCSYWTTLTQMLWLLETNWRKKKVSGKQVFLFLILIFFLWRACKLPFRDKQTYLEIVISVFDSRMFLFIFILVFIFILY